MTQRGSRTSRLTPVGTRRGLLQGGGKNSLKVTKKSKKDISPIPRSMVLGEKQKPLPERVVRVLESLGFQFPVKR